MALKNNNNEKIPWILGKNYEKAARNSGGAPGFRPMSPCRPSTPALRHLLQKDIQLFGATIVKQPFAPSKKKLPAITYLCHSILSCLRCQSYGDCKAVLSHAINGQEHPVSFASRSLTVAEQNYSQLER